MAGVEWPSAANGKRSFMKKSPDVESAKGAKEPTMVAGEAGEAGELVAELPRPDCTEASLVDDEAITVADESEAKLWIDEELESRLGTSNQ
jgi:hypothetical protein